MDGNLKPLSAEELEGLDNLLLDSMDRKSLETLLARVRATYPALEAWEPGDETSEEYLLWQEDLEMLDDFLDELTERLA